MVVLRIMRWYTVLTMHQRTLLCKARREAESAMRFASSGMVSLAARARGEDCGVAGCALAVAAHRRSKMQRERREAEREE